MSDYYFAGRNPSVDNVIAREFNGMWQVLLIKRKGPVEKDKWALPGGFVDSNARRGDAWKYDKESYLEAATRELKEETGLELCEQAPIELQTRCGKSKSRDPRDSQYSWSESHPYAFKLRGSLAGEPTAGDDAADARWHNLKDVLKPTYECAFDHIDIIKEAIEKLGIMGDSS